MFTGIIRGIGLVAEAALKNSILRYAIQFPADLLHGLEQGASVSVDGACQTVVKIDQDQIWFEAIGETLERTTLNGLQKGRRVNLERAACFGDEIGGHLLSGHIYGTAPLISINQNIYTFRGSSAWMKYLFSKGYIAIDGISLTLVDVGQDNFSVHLIPETLSHTNIGQKKLSESANIEIDSITQAAVDTVTRLLSR